jgi:meso-butanediol dehydrogenase/(S,S)-butanediol dehydrogenase/diacetyl reductase
MFGRVEGRSILVTGGGSGMGRVVSIALANEGADVTILDLNADAANAVRDEIVAAGGSATSLSGDVTVREDVARAVSTAVEAFGKLDVLFAIAGMIKPQMFLDITEDNFRLTTDVNTLGTLICQQEAAKQMIKQGHGGKLILTSSIAGRQGYGNFGSYCASKFGVIALNQSAAHALAEHHITSNAFAPGVVDTPLWRKLDEDLVEIGASKEVGQAWNEFSGANLIGRKGVAEDVIGTALFLASSDSDYMTGQVIMIDGGMVLV